MSHIKSEVPEVRYISFLSISDKPDRICVRVKLDNFEKNTIDTVEFMASEEIRTQSDMTGTEWDRILNVIKKKLYDNEQ